MLIRGVEKKVDLTIDGFYFKGFIDRLDQTADGLRVVDYKTGRVEPDDLFFNPRKTDVPEIGLQLYLYKRMLGAGEPVTGAIYHPASLIAGAPLIEHELDEDFCRRMDAVIDGMLADVSDLSIPWRRTEDTGKCAFCDFRAICGR